MKRIAISIGLIALVCLTSCTSKTKIKEEATKYTVTNPVLLDTSITKNYVSQIKSIRNIEIRSLEKGFIQNIYVDEGQYVKAGQLLFKIAPKVLEAESKRSNSEVKAAEIDYQNTKILADKNIISKNELAMAQTKLDQAKAGLSLAKFHLSASIIRAPFSGYINRIPNKIGSLIDEGALLTTLSDNSQMYAYFNVSEPEYLNYVGDVKDRGSKKVSLLLANNTLLPYTGEVQTVEGEFDSETGSIAFRAKFPNPDKLLKNGETGAVLMTVPLKNALLIPQKTTYEIQDKIYVFVVGKNNVIHSQEITVGTKMPDLYVVTNGLSANDKILLEGVQKVKDGDKIEFKNLDPKVVISQLKLKAN